MTAFLHHVAGAALPVAVALLAATTVSHVVLWTRAGDGQLQRTARRYLQPFAIWCIIACGVTVLATGAAGDAGLGGFVAPVAIGLVAALMQSEMEDAEPAAIRASNDPDESVAEAAPEPPPVAPVEPPATSVAVRTLWSEPSDEAVQPRGLWSRA